MCGDGGLISVVASLKYNGPTGEKVRLQSGLELRDPDRQATWSHVKVGRRSAYLTAARHFEKAERTSEREELLGPDVREMS